MKTTDMTTSARLYRASSSSAPLAPHAPVSSMISTTCVHTRVGRRDRPAGRHSQRARAVLYERHRSVGDWVWPPEGECVGAQGHGTCPKMRIALR